MGGAWVGLLRGRIDRGGGGGGALGVPSLSPLCSWCDDHEGRGDGAGNDAATRGGVAWRARVGPASLLL